MRLRAIAILGVLGLSTACGQATESRSDPASATNENVEQVLTKMEQDWVQALIKGDAAFHESLLADDYVGVGPSGLIRNKAESVADVRSGAGTTESMNINGVKVRVFGDVAVVTYSQTEKSQYRGKDTSGPTRWTDIFVKRNGKWQIAANHGSRVDDVPTQASDPLAGTWELNVAKSKYNPGPPPKSQTRTYETSGQTVKFTGKGVDSQGNPSLIQWTASYDGKDYPITGDPGADAISFKRIDASRIDFTQKQAGKVVGTGTRSTTDGKVMTVTYSGTSAKGQAFNNVVVFEKR